MGTGKLRGVALATASGAAALAAVTLGAAGCSAPSPPADLGVDTGNPGLLYGLPADGGSTTDLGTDAGLMGAYGGPPPSDAGTHHSGGDAALYGNAPP